MTSYKNNFGQYLGTGKSKQISKAYSEPGQKFKLKWFAEIVNSLKSLTIFSKSYIQILTGSECASKFSMVAQNRNTQIENIKDSNVTVTNNMGNPKTRGTFSSF